MEKEILNPNDGLPASLQTEVTILGSCLLSQDAFNDALELLSAEDFVLDSHQRIFTSISDLFETGNHADLVTVMEDLKRRRWLDAVGGAAYLAFLTEGIPRNPNIAAYCKIVKEKSALRQLLSIFNDGMVRASDQSETSVDIIGDLEERILEVAQIQNMQAFSTFLDAIEEAGGPDQYMDAMCDPKKLTGLPMGFIDIDKMLGGMEKKTLIIIAARPSMGKTALAINIAVNIVMQDPEKVIAIFSLESSKESLHKRILAGEAEVSGRRAAEGFISREERARLASTLIRMADRHLMIDDTPGLSTMQIRAKCRRLKQRMGRLDLVVIDYLQLMKATGKHGSREQEVSSISRGSKALAKELDVPVVALAQLSRKNEERGDKRPMLSDLRESGSIEQDADVVAFIHRAEYYASDDDPNVERGIAEIIISKNREGSTGTRKLAYRADITKFNNLMVEGSTNDY